VADTFNEMKRLDEEHIERDLRILIQSIRASGEVPDFGKLHRVFVFNALAKGFSKKGAQAQASLKILEMKRIMDPGSDEST
jgi:hypothetical protein